MSRPDHTPLSGYRVAVTSARRADELCTMLRRHGATVCAAPAIAMIDLTDDDELRRRTEELIAVPPDILVVTTAIGFRGWIAAAEGWGLVDDLITALRSARIVARGPKAVGALRAAGLPEEWSPESESSAAMLGYLLQSGIGGCRIAVQLHGSTGGGDPIPELLDQLRSGGADVLPIRVYRWRAARPGGEFDQLTTEIAQRQFDAVSFTSAAAVLATLMRATELGLTDQLLGALRSDVHAMCVGPVTARPLALLGVPTSSPGRMRLGALARHIVDQLPRLRTQTVYAAGHRIEVRSSCVMVDGVTRSISPAGMATLRVLAHNPGKVVSRDDLLEALPGNGSNTHAVETAVLRLRTALGDKNIVATVVKRGYRLAVD
ncbi:uroporphyrinogen-III synthase [Mycolicibacter terrae]|uniref:Uroporphyrinogen-III synthase n=1 Tax=Mycolicibacter terrae TaxID=1788 RepID=A0AAD1MIC7_9MYCO|nr:uroporphyrinogen-III synthase [Mycolicibacter terrae]ORW93756.1 bifunctional uroporphyrinogen-III synthetase/response regulator domain protein [Mycolicibacter terrae]BBX24403.1 uroporphyrinogen-III synthase [Mycolicibacter terrae]SNV53854.1 bifunctional uroporphyrinogen-III synthetase/response regulator domain-containing protein [Mycolicibacter terrae]